MEFSEKLQMLRKSKGMSQEDLANELEVSRQAVSKWESGQAYPETEKLLQLSEWFGVSVDYLLKPDATGSGAGFPPAGAGALPVDRGMVQGFLAERKLQAQYTALGIGILVASLCFIMGISSGWGILLMLLCVGIGVAVMIYSTYLPRQYAQMEQQPLAFEPGLLDDFGPYAADLHRRNGQLIIAGVMLLILGVAVLVSGRMLPAFLGGMIRTAAPLCWAAGVLLFVYAGLQASTLSMLTDNPKYMREKRSEKSTGWVFGMIMPLTAMLYLILGFFFHLWHPGWLVFPIAALSCEAYTVWKGKRK